MHLNVIKCIMYDKLSFECPKSIKLKVFSRIDVNNCLSTSKYEWQFLRRYKSQVFARFCRSRFKQQLPCGIGQKGNIKYNISILDDVLSIHWVNHTFGTKNIYTHCSMSHATP